MLRLPRLGQTPHGRRREAGGIHPEQRQILGQERPARAKLVRRPQPLHRHPSAQLRGRRQRAGGRPRRLRWPKYTASRSLGLIANCRCKAAFGVADIETAREIAAMLGQQTIITESATAKEGMILERSSRTRSETGRALLMPDEILRLPAHQQILMLPGQSPVLAGKVRCCDDPTFKGLWHWWG
jgi:hypothetical protein